MYFLFDEIGLFTVIVGCFFGGFLPLMILLMLTPEARAHIAARVKGGIIVASFCDTGQAEYVRAEPKGGEGQYISGRNKWGQRRIFVKPRMETGILTKAFILKGIRRPIFLHYAGKTPIVTPETLAAIEVAEMPIDKRDNLPKEVQEWAKKNQLVIKEPVVAEVEEELRSSPDEKNPGGSVVGTQKVRRIVGFTDIFQTLFTLDPRKINQYFSEHYDESQYDNLLESARLEGLQEGREGKKLPIGKLGWIILICIILGVVGLLIAAGLGVI